MIVFGDRVSDYVAERIAHLVVPPFTAIGRERDGRIVSGAVFNCYTGPDIEVTIAAEPGGVTKGLIAACGRYVFGQLGCERLSVTTEHAAVAHMAMRLGAVREGIKHHAFGRGRHGITLGIYRESWTFGR